MQKENYDPWDTTLTLQPAQKLKFSITLQEKSIFSNEGEINFTKIIARDTTAEGYRERIYNIWLSHADSILKGELKVDPCLDMDYVIGKKL